MLLKKTVKLMAVFVIVFQLLFICGCDEEIKVTKGPALYSEKGVEITDEGRYFNVVLDYTQGLNRKEMGEAYGRAILNMVPDYTKLLDSYLSESHNKIEYRYTMYDNEGLRTQIDEEYADELDGLSEVISKGASDERNDDKVSKNEIYLYNLMADTIGTQCSFVSVYGERSSTGSTIAGRNLDWFGGSKNQISQFQAVVTYKYADREVVSIGYLGFMGIISGINDANSFAAILVSPTGEAYDSQGKRSYPLDLRKALETCRGIDSIADYMKDSKHYYALNHIIALSDENKSIVLENNFSGFGPNDMRVRRAVRTEDSKLNNGINWGIKNAVGSVNSFLLYGNYDNHTHESSNTDRWETMKKTLLSCGNTVTPEKLQSVITHINGEIGAASESGCLYNRETTQMIIFQPKTRNLSVYFRPKNSEKNEESPQFVNVPIFSE